jgi:hypothetical protein
MTRLTVKEYICQKMIVRRNHNPVLSSLMTYHQISNKINTKRATNRTGTAYSSGAPAFTSGF